MVTNRITSGGYIHLSEEEYYEEVTQTALGEGIDIQPYTNNMAVAKVFTKVFDAVYQDVNTMRSNLSPLEAEGQALDELCLLKSLTRLIGSKARVEIALMATHVVDLDVGELQVSTDSGIRFINTTPINITQSNGQGSAIFEAVEIGTAGNLEAGAIRNFDTSGTNIIALSSDVAHGGTDREIDADLRVRLLNTYPSVLSVARLEQELIKIEGIEYAKVINNYSETGTGSNGVPYGFSVIVIDDNSATFSTELKKTIWDTIRANSAIGETWHAPTHAVTLSYTDSGAVIEYPIVRPSASPIKVKIEVASRLDVSDDLKIVTVTALIEMLGTKKTGAFLKASEFFNKIYTEIVDYRDASSVAVTIKETDDAIDGTSLQMRYDKRATLTSNDVEIIFNTVAIT